MNKHEVDECGYPVDPTLRALEFRLCDIATEWRGCVGVNENKQKNLEKEYHQIMEKLYELGWDTEIDIDCYLPLKLMPQEYLKRNPWE